MASSPRNKKSPDVDRFSRAKSPMASLIKHNVAENIAENFSSDENDFRKTPSPTSTIRAESYARLCSFSPESFGDARTSRLERNSKIFKEFALLPEIFPQSIPSKSAITTNEVIHIDIAPDKKYDGKDELLSVKELQHIQEIKQCKSKIFIENAVKSKVKEPDPVKANEGPKEPEIISESSQLQTKWKSCPEMLIPKCEISCAANESFPGKGASRRKRKSFKEKLLDLLVCAWCM